MAYYDKNMIKNFEEDINQEIEIKYDVYNKFKKTSLNIFKDDKNEYLRYSKSCKPKSWNSAYIRLYHDRVLVYEKYKEKFYG